MKTSIYMAESEIFESKRIYCDQNIFQAENTESAIDAAAHWAQSEADRGVEGFVHHISVRPLFVMLYDYSSPISSWKGRKLFNWSFDDLESLEEAVKTAKERND